MGGKVSNDIPSESTEQIHSQEAWIVLGSVTSKDVNELWKNGMLASILLTWSHMGVKVSNDIASGSTQMHYILKTAGRRGKWTKGVSGVSTYIKHVYRARFTVNC